MQLLIKFGIIVLLITTTVVGRSLRLGELGDNPESLDNSGSNNSCVCDKRYLKHYEIKNCTVVNTDSCGCPKKFECPLNSTEERTGVCIYEGKEYQVGSKISINNHCQVCRCLDELKPHVVCTSKECPPLQAMWGENCHPVYGNRKCCPFAYECVGKESIHGVKEISCEYDGVKYPLGAKISPKDDPCLICDCTANWNGTDDSSCHQQECILQQSKAQLDDGCIPVYHENKCCPIEFYCSGDHNSSYSVAQDGVLNETSTESEGDTCVFAGKFYEIGAELEVDNGCMRCTCQVPPDFTCVHKSCPIPRNVKHCFAHEIEDECCLYYVCSVGDYSLDDDTTELVCPTPICADSSCHIEIPPGHQCPTCICKAPETLERNILEATQQVLTDPTNNGENTEFENHSVNDSNEEYTVSREKEIYEEPKYAANAESEGSDFKKNSGDLKSNEIYARREPKKRSVNSDLAVTQKVSTSESGLSHVSVQPLQQDQFAQNQQQVVNENSEIERETYVESGEDFDEMQLFGKRGSASEEKLGNEITGLDDDKDSYIPLTSEIVPDGCPTPMCADSSCRIGIPQGHQCPVCICKGRGDRQP